MKKTLVALSLLLAIAAQSQPRWSVCRIVQKADSSYNITIIAECDIKNQMPTFLGGVGLDNIYSFSFTQKGVSIPAKRIDYTYCQICYVKKAPKRIFRPSLVSYFEFHLPKSVSCGIVQCIITERKVQQADLSINL